MRQLKKGGSDHARPCLIGWTQDKRIGNWQRKTSYPSHMHVSTILLDLSIQENSVCADFLAPLVEGHYSDDPQRMPRKLLR
jgi:hypothetical protein